MTPMFFGFITSLAPFTDKNGPNGVFTKCSGAPSSSFLYLAFVLGVFWHVSHLLFVDLVRKET